MEGYDAHDLPLNYLVLDVDWHRENAEVAGCDLPQVGVMRNPLCWHGYGGYSCEYRHRLLLSFSQHVAQRLPEDDRYTDGDILSADEAPCRGAILPSSRNRVRELLRGAINDILEDDQAFEAWVGEVLTARTSGTQLSRMLRTDAKPTLADDVMDDNEVVEQIYNMNEEQTDQSIQPKIGEYWSVKHGNNSLFAIVCSEIISTIAIAEARSATGGHPRRHQCESRNQFSKEQICL